MPDEEFARFTIGSYWCNDGTSDLSVECRECEEEIISVPDGRVAVPDLLAKLRDHSAARHA